jgi:hypothetical protein
MPTGYTAAIKDGIDFRTYAMDCARAFGACVMLRDEDGGGDKIPEAFAPSDYNAKALAKARADLAAVQAMSREDCALSAANAWQEHESYRLRVLAERADLRKKYETMLAEVKAWTPPTSEHFEFHKFMREQIEQSIVFDCSPDSSYLQPQPKQSGDAWRAKVVARLLRDIEYHERQNAEEIDRTRQRNQWIAALRESLQGEPA